MLSSVRYSRIVKPVSYRTGPANDLIFSDLLLFPLSHIRTLYREACESADKQSNLQAVSPA